MFIFQITCFQYSNSVWKSYNHIHDAAQLCQRSLRPAPPRLRVACAYLNARLFAIVKAENNCAFSAVNPLFCLRFIFPAHLQPPLSPLPPHLLLFAMGIFSRCARFARRRFARRRATHHPNLATLRHITNAPQTSHSQVPGGAGTSQEGGACLLRAGRGTA